MASSTREPAHYSELEIHKKAYTQLFQAVLKKVPGSNEKKQEILSRLTSYLNSNVNSTDEFIDHMNEYAREMSVPVAALGKFIGSNFMQALTLARKELETARAKTIKKTYSSFLEELVDVLDLDSPGRFVSHEMGLVKLETPAGTRFPASGGAPEAGAAPELEVTEPEAPPGKAPSSTVTAKTPSAGKKNSDLSTDTDPPVLEEILSHYCDLFGPDRERLVLAAFTPTNSDSTDEEPEEDAINESSAPGAKKSAPTRPPAPEFESDEGGSILADLGQFLGESVPPIKAPLKPDPFFGETRSPAKGPAPGESSEEEESDEPSPAEKVVRASSPEFESDEGGSILEEIVSEFGDSLVVGEKLIVSSGLEEGAEYEDNEPEEDEEDEPEDFVPSFTEIPLSYEQYIALSRSIQEFQQKNDREGYRTWMQQKGGVRARLCVGIRNLETKQRKGESVDWEREYASLAAATGQEAASVRYYHTRLQQFTKLQQLLQRLTIEVKSKGGELLHAFKPIWVQIRQLFSEPGDETSYRSRMKIILLQVADPLVKDEILRMMEPIFRKATEILKSDR